MGTYEDAEAVAARYGREAGMAAASWYFDGNTSRDTYAAVLRGLDEGDPEVLDTLPSAPLSGVWADQPTEGDVLMAVADESGYVITDDDRDAILSAYEDGYETMAAHEIERVARYQIGDES